MSTITKVALAGATGNLGPAILTQLLSANFKVTVLTRPTSTNSFPPTVTVLPVDYTSLDSLTSALTGQDAFVSTLGAAALATQLLLVEAAAKAHVKRFIPSEFGCDTLNPKARTLPVFADKVRVQDALAKEAADGTMTYTLIATGPFLDWGIAIGFIMNLKEKSISLYDGGDRPFSASSLATIGKAVVGVLKHLDETENRAVYVHDTALTLKELASMGKKATGADGWTESAASVDEVLGQAWAELKKEKPDPSVFAYNFIKAAIWGEGYGGKFEKVDNGVLGLAEMSGEEVQGLVDGLAK